MSKILLVGVSVLALAGCVPAGRVADTVPVTDEVKAEMFGTSPEFERDLRECLVAHPIPANHTPGHPASVPLAECVADVYAAHGGAK
ncbi:hypothetical protein [Glutamicibacter nicotianae]|uniref:hypothetical protein n=1 Tax=Glutamicibacter nicotianae TaxID=37929 RepID=UPI0013CE62B0|nr:hypothetical protein [Glutamicibacter nicotianae]